MNNTLLSLIAIHEPSLEYCVNRYHHGHLAQGLSVYVRPDGVIIYHKDGKKHRDNGPAQIGEWTHYYKNGRLHRVGGPALFGEDQVAYYNEGHLHRIDGPALTVGKEEMWYFLGLRVDKESIDAWVRHYLDAIPELVVDPETLELRLIGWL